MFEMKNEKDRDRYIDKEGRDRERERKTANQVAQTYNIYNSEDTRKNKIMEICKCGSPFKKEG